MKAYLTFIPTPLLLTVAVGDCQHLPMQTDPKLVAGRGRRASAVGNGRSTRGFRWLFCKALSLFVFVTVLYAKRCKMKPQLIRVILFLVDKDGPRCMSAIQFYVRATYLACQRFISLALRVSV